jgi:hypothetical protein
MGPDPGFDPGGCAALTASPEHEQPSLVAGGRSGFRGERVGGDALWKSGSRSKARKG